MRNMGECKQMALAGVRSDSPGDLPRRWGIMTLECGCAKTMWRLAGVHQHPAFVSITVELQVLLFTNSYFLLYTSAIPISQHLLHRIYKPSACPKYLPPKTKCSSTSPTKRSRSTKPRRKRASRKLQHRRNRPIARLTALPFLSKSTLISTSPLLCSAEKMRGF